MMNLGVYIHIPFCIKKCRYCDFISFESGEHNSYFEALYKEIDLYKGYLKTRNIDSIFIGGGTPSAVNPQFIEKILSKFNVSDDCEITIETNPKTLDKEKLKIYVDSGINRISIGMQSANDNELKLLGRAHSYSDFLKSYELIVNSGIKNINIDTMFGIPDQTFESFKRTVDEVIKLNPAHISSYSLIIEEGTPFHNMKLNLPCESTEREMYGYLKNAFSGYERYEISNFAKPGFECKHNLKYWEMKDYLGVGLNSHSFIDNTRFFNTKSMNAYINKLSNGKHPVDGFEKEDNKELLKDFVITGLRLKKGIDLNDVKKRFNIDFYTEHKTVIDKYLGMNLISLEEEKIKLTESGISVSNYILSDFI